MVAWMLGCLDAVQLPVVLLWLRLRFGGPFSLPGWGAGLCPLWRTLDLVGIEYLR